MTELTLKTRLLNKMSEGTVADLRKGEINFCPVTVTVDVEKQKQETYLVMEVGGTDKSFAAKASDVYEWAKAETKPKYKAGEIEGLADYISGEIEDTNTKYSFEVDNGQIVIKHKEVKDENYKYLTAIDIITETELTAILDDYVTETELAEALSNFQTQLNLGQYATIAYVDGEIDKVEAQITAVDKKVDGVSAVANAAAVKADVDAALDKKIDKEEGKSLVDNAEIARLATLVNYDDTTIKADIKNNADAIDAIEADYLKAADKTELANAISAEASRADAAEKKALADAKAYADGLVSAEASRADAAVEAAENAAKAYADGIKASILGDDLTETFDTLKAVQEWVDSHEDVTVVGLTESIAAEAKAREDADTALDGKITAEAAARDAADVALGERIDAVSEVAGAAQTANEVANAIDTKIAALKAEDLWDGKGAADAALEAAKADATTKANAAEAAAKAYADANDKDTTYTAGAGLILNGTVFSIDVANTVFVLDANA